MRGLAIQACRELLDEWERCDLQDIERRLALLESAGRIAANRALEDEKPVVVDLRERTLQALFASLREGLQQTREPLLLMLECPGLSPERKQEIEERLTKVFGLVRAGAPR
jgi:hypothetical protein